LQVVPGSQFVQTSNGITQVYRQASLAGDAGAIHGADMIHQSIAADIRINAFNGEDRWVGLMTRYTDDANYYYITLRDSNWLILKRMQDGVFTELARASVNVVAGVPRRAKGGLCSRQGAHAWPRGHPHVQGSGGLRQPGDQPRTHERDGVRVPQDRGR
jgi:hypothetical protein